MAVLKILSYSLIFIVATASFIEENSTAVLNYNIQFVLHVNTSFFHGGYNVSIYIPHETQDIYFYTENLAINRITVTNSTQISKENEEKDFVHRPKNLTYDTETYITTISFPYNLSSGSYILNIKYFGLFSEDAGFRKYINKQNDRVLLWLAATHDRTFGIRKLFPLLKDTAYASYNISIKHHKNYTALSNMLVQEVQMDENNMQWTRFKSTPVVPISFIAASVVHFANISGTNQSAILWCRGNILPDVQLAYVVTKNVTQFLGEKMPYIRKTPKINHIAIPEFFVAEEIMLGSVFYSEEDIIFNQETNDEIRNVRIMRIVGYKVVHEWLCNAINPYKWESWSIKGFAAFFGMYAADKKLPNFRLRDFFVVHMQHDLLHWSTKDTWPLTIKSKFNSSFKFPHYIKVCIMFRTLQIVLTEETFESGIKRYLQNHYTSVSDLWNVMQSSLNESSIKPKYDLKDRIINWVLLNHYPVINVKRNYDANWVNISMKNSTNIWTFVNITTQSHFDLKIIFPILWLGPKKLYQLQSIDFKDNNDWVLVNLQQSGCYRVNYDVENWNRLSKYLNNNTFEKIHLLDRVKIIDDAFHFLMTGELNSDVFWSLSHYLSRDTDYIAWYPMFKNLEYMSGFFAFPESAPIKTQIMQPLSEILRVIKYPDFKLGRIIQGSIFTKCLREEAARWLCTLSYDYCLSVANHELKSYLKSCNRSSPYKIGMNWKEWTFCNGLITASDDTWLQVFNIYLKESDYSILKFLACSNNSLIIFSYINVMTLDSALGKVITDFDHVNSFCFIIARHARNIEVFNFILINLERIKPKKINFITALTVIINHVYSKEQIAKIKKYVNDKIQYVLKYPVPSPISYDRDSQNDDKFNESLPSKNISKNISKEKYEENKKEYKEMIIIQLNRKLELRWHQIKTQLYEYRYLIKNFQDIFKKYSAD